jgi:hypothetical protein
VATGINSGSCTGPWGRVRLAARALVVCTVVRLVQVKQEKIEAYGATSNQLKGQRRGHRSHSQDERDGKSGRRVGG